MCRQYRISLKRKIGMKIVYLTEAGKEFLIRQPSVLNIISNLQQNITTVRYIQEFIAYNYYNEFFKLVFITTLIVSGTI